MTRLAGLVFAVALVPLGAHAADDALSLYQSGAYERAIAAGTGTHDAPGYAVAARAALAEATMRDAPCLECLERAENFARQAVSDDQTLPEAHVYLAVALGYEARIIGPIRARFGGYAEQAKSNIDAALAKQPQDAWALAALGGWNIEIVRAGGKTLARWLYHATLETGLDSFAQAFRIAPGNIVLRYQYALALAGYDLDTYRGEVDAALGVATTGTTTSAYDRFIQDRARELAAALKAGDRYAVANLVKRDQGYP